MVADDVEEEENDAGSVPGFVGRAEVEDLQQAFGEEARRQGGECDEEERTSADAVHGEDDDEDLDRANPGEDGVHDQRHIALHAQALVD